MTKLFDVHITEDGERLSVVPVWTNVDRPTTLTWGLKKRDRKLAERFKKAMLAGKVFKNISVVKDIYGQTYAQADCTVWARQMNADLKKLGF